MQVDKTTDTKVAAEADRATTSCTECQRRKQKVSVTSGFSERVNDAELIAVQQRVAMRPL